MQTNQAVIDDLTTLLEGTSMGINTFLSYLKEVQALPLKEALVNAVEVFKKHDKALREHIVNCGECASEDTKISVMMAEFMEKMKAQVASDDRSLLDLATNGIDMALKAVKDFKKKHQDLREDCLDAINAMEDDYKKIYQTLIDLKLNEVS